MEIQTQEKATLPEVRRSLKTVTVYSCGCTTTVVHGASGQGEEPRCAGHAGRALRRVETMEYGRLVNSEE